MKSLKFGSNLKKKNCKKKPKNFHFSLQNLFSSVKEYIFNLNSVYSDRYELDHSDETIIIKNFHFSRKL